VAVNLTGLDLSGTTASSTHKASSTPNIATNTPTTQDATQQPQKEVSVSSTASLLSRLQRSLGSTPAVDQNRVDSISKALAAGTYKVDSDKIAHGLINTERALGLAARRAS
jgi:negative regulator of flagellin synthesis FlgM